MNRKKVLVAMVFLVNAGFAFAETPATIAAGYAAEAAKVSPGFSPSKERGREIFTRKWGVSQAMPNCASCHGEPMAAGSHVITGKRISPLAPAANPERFTKAAKVEKWFGRNCREVVGRECTPAEKADFMEFVLKGGRA